MAGRKNRSAINHGDNSAISSFFQAPKLTDTQFKKFSTLIYEKAGIYLKPEKKELLNARLGKRLRACRTNCYDDYYDVVINDATGMELVHLIDVVSTNFTSFFREQAHFDFLVSTALPAIVNSGINRNNQILVWSAACSSGEEPYTLAMVLDSYLSSLPDWHYSIMATDISTRVLAQAERGVYTMDRVAKVGRDILKRYFQKGEGRSDGFVKIKDSVRQMISFMRLNLMDDFEWERPLDIIFCRNVMIYFDKATQETLINKFYRSLGPGGYLFIGHSESISNLNHDFKQITAATYQK